MIRVVSKNVKAVLPNTNHHETEIAPFRTALLNGIIASNLARDDKIHILRQGRTGPNSWSLHVRNGQVYRFRMYTPFTSLEVKNGTSSRTFSDPHHLYRWASNLKG